MIKKINISEEVVARLVKSNKCVEGSLSYDRETGKITFKAYNRQARVREKDRLVKKEFDSAKLYYNTKKGILKIELEDGSYIAINEEDD